MKVLVAHPAQQHSYRLASALSKAGCLYKYATTVYCKDISLTKAVARVLKGGFKAKAEARRCEELDDDQVIQFCEAEGLIKLLAMNIKPFRPLYRRIKYHVSDRFARRVAKYAVRHNVDAVVCYDDCSALLFELLAERAPKVKRILDMSAANVLYMRDIYEKDMELQPRFADKLKSERKIVWDNKTAENARSEIELANGFIAASEFTKKSLTAYGAREESIVICPYGVDTELFTAKAERDINAYRGPLNFIFVGGAKELKGIAYLLEAFSRIPKEEAVLTVVGQADLESEELSPYLDKVRFTGQVLHERIPDLLKAADVFVFPSLGDGFSLAVLEAASCGLPLIVSENTGAGELIRDGIEGFVIPIQSSEAIRDRIEWFIQNPNVIKTMGAAARKMAEQYKWERYDQAIKAAFSEPGLRKWAE